MSEHTDIPQWAMDRANELAGGESYRAAFARYIAEHEQPPVDPLLIEARDICAKSCEQQGRRVGAADFRAGERDHWLSDVITGLRRGIEIGRAG